MGKLYVVATPIGNLEDLSFRALRVLSEVRTVLAEDTRTARVLLAHYGIKARGLLSYTEHNSGRRTPEALRLLETFDVALISDAGTPAISDPGVELVAAARAAGHEVVAVPGPSALVAALSIAGLPTDCFRFVGFLPRQVSALKRLLEEQRLRSETLVAFESPQRIERSLAALADALPERRVAVCRELTKLHEEVFVGTAAEARDRFRMPRGEFVLIIEGARAAEQRVVDEVALVEEVRLMREVGLSRSQAAALLSPRYGVSKRRLYQLWLGR